MEVGRGLFLCLKQGDIRGMQLRVLMLGWEFPPFISGGLGTACHGLTQAMSRLDTRILFVLPKALGDDAVQVGSVPGSGGVGVADAALTTGGAERLCFARVPAGFRNPYGRPFAGVGGDPESERLAAALAVVGSSERPASLRVVGAGSEDGYDGDLLGKIYDYAARCTSLLRHEEFDVIHAHDWMTFPAAMRLAAASGKPLIAHVHATEFDRSGNFVHSAVFEIEKAGMQAAERVITVSELTRRTVLRHYGMAPEKVDVVHNGIEFQNVKPVTAERSGGAKVVLFLGRITMQKGPEFFVRAAARVAEQMDNVRFVIAGNGDLVPRVRNLVAELGLQEKVEMPGFLRGAAVERAYAAADVYVMPSITEPFGLTALEAARHGVPVVLSKTAGAAEVLGRGALQVDFWDVNMMACMIDSVLRYPGLAAGLRREAYAEILKLTWDEAARKCLRLYRQHVSGRGRSERFTSRVSVERELATVV